MLPFFVFFFISHSTINEHFEFDLNCKSRDNAMKRAICKGYSRATSQTIEMDPKKKWTDCWSLIINYSQTHFHRHEWKKHPWKRNQLSSINRTIIQLRKEIEKKAINNTPNHRITAHQITNNGPITNNKQINRKC